jgi:uncharacterized protein with PCYCGC motif
MTSKFIGAAGTLLAVVIVAAAGAGPIAQTGGASTAVAPMKPAPPGQLPPLPSVNYAPARPMTVVQQVYEFAARHPEVLQYVPCYCGCQRVGHRGNHDCFVKSRATNGRVLEWDAHGIGCAVCLEVGHRAMMLFNDKKSVAEIRATIDKEYGSRAPTQTPTPRPPQTGKG